MCKQIREEPCQGCRDEQGTFQMPKEVSERAVKTRYLEEQLRCHIECGYRQESKIQGGKYLSGGHKLGRFRKWQLCNLNRLKAFFKLFHPAPSVRNMSCHRRPQSHIYIGNKNCTKEYFILWWMHSLCYALFSSSLLFSTYFHVAKKHVWNVRCFFHNPTAVNKLINAALMDGRGGSTLPES